MTEHITDIEGELKAKEVEIYETSVAYREESKKAGEAQGAYKKAYAKAVLVVKASDEKMSVAEKEATATLMVERELMEHYISSAIADGSKKHLEALQAILSSIQTRSRMIQTERSLTGRQV